MHEEPNPQSDGQPPKVSRLHAISQALFALDSVYIAVAAVACVGVAVYAVVHLDIETLIFAVVGLVTVFVLGCIVFGVQNLGRRR